MTTTIVIGQRRVQVTSSADAHRLIMDGLGWVVGTGQSVEPMSQPKRSPWSRQQNRRKSRR